MPFVIDAANMHYRRLNRLVREALESQQEIILENVNGQRYIGDALKGDYLLMIKGVPGNDLAIFMDGATVIVKGNVQDGTANTMNDGEVVIHGMAGDALGYGMRGGRVFVRDDVGYRAGIHMKEYLDKIPVLVIGGTAGDFLGEYMAGGIILVLNRNNIVPAVGRYCATGMHGGVIFIKGSENAKWLEGLNVTCPNGKDMALIRNCIERYNSHFNLQVPVEGKEAYLKIVPDDVRPYKKLYVGV